MSTTVDDWSDFFPPTNEGVRPDQEKAINFILDRVKDGVTNIFLEAPTGVGKSFLAWTVAQYCAAEMGWRTRILVPNLYLENQYVTDFGRLGMLRLESARHYGCPEFGGCDVGRGTEMVPQQGLSPETSFKCPNNPSATCASIETWPGPSQPVGAAGNVGAESGPNVAPAAVTASTNGAPKCKNLDCSYVKARVAFAQCPVGVSNTAYAFTCARFGHAFVSGDFLVADEGHNLGDQISSLYEVSVDCPLAPEGPAIGQEFAWLKGVYLPMLNNRINALRIAIDQPGLPTSDVAKLTSRLTKFSNEAINVAFITSTPEDEWVISRPPGSIKVQPLWASRVAPKLLNFLAPRRLFMSGTFLDYNHHVSSLGL